MITPINDHVARTLALLLEQFKKKPNFKKLVEVLVAPFQECEDVAWQLYGYRSLPNAVGAQLDNIGDIFAVPRAGRDDAEYRQAIYLKIFEIGVSGTPDELMTVLKTVTGSTEVGYTPRYPASAQLYANGTDIPPGLLEFMTKLTPAGVNLWIYTFEGMLPIGVAAESGINLLLVNGEYIAVQPDDELLGVGEEIQPLPRADCGTLCDIDPDGTIITYPDSGRAFDVLQAA